jgi:hypothetical protein
MKERGQEDREGKERRGVKLSVAWLGLVLFSRVTRQYWV